MKVLKINSSFSHRLFVALRSFVLLVVVAGLINIGMPHGRAVPIELRVKSDSQIRSEAALYDAAIREISRIETMTLATADDFKPVRSILERHVPNLRFNRSKAVTIGLAESTFVNAAKARTSDRAKADEFARELAADNQAIFRLSGAQSVKDKINQSVKNDMSMLRRVSERMQRAAEEIKAKSPAHHANPNPRFMDSRESIVQGVSVGDVLAAVVVTSLVISVAMIIGGPMALVAMIALTTAVVGGVVSGVAYVPAVIAVAAASLVGRIAANVGSEESRDKLKECMENVDARYRQCVQQGGVLGTPFCLIQYVANAAGCITAE